MVLECWTDRVSVLITIISSSNTYIVHPVHFIYIFFLNYKNQEILHRYLVKPLKKFNQKMLEKICQKDSFLSENRWKSVKINNIAFYIQQHFSVYIEIHYILIFKKNIWKNRSFVVNTKYNVKKVYSKHHLWLISHDHYAKEKLFKFVT